MIDFVADPPISEDDGREIICMDWAEVMRTLDMGDSFITHNPCRSVVILKQPISVVCYAMRRHYAKMPFLPPLDWFNDILSSVAKSARSTNTLIELYKTDSLLARVRTLFLENSGHTFCSGRSLDKWVAEKIGQQVNRSTIGIAKLHARILAGWQADCRKYDHGRPELVAI